MKRKVKDFLVGDWIHGSPGNRARIKDLNSGDLIGSRVIAVDTEFGTMYLDPEEEWEYELA